MHRIESSLEGVWIPESEARRRGSLDGHQHDEIARNDAIVRIERDGTMDLSGTMFGVILGKLKREGDQFESHPYRYEIVWTKFLPSRSIVALKVTDRNDENSNLVLIVAKLMANGLMNYCECFVDPDPEGVGKAGDSNRKYLLCGDSNLMYRTSRN
ncbi:MAG TPA: hypothetical protein VJZ71_08050 [Phycisphaerae bacterium]|nr:hypothetical protein [Phycisphaerae bacterium]